jgi:hypothetical protein
VFFLVEADFVAQVGDDDRCDGWLGILAQQR